MSFGGRRKRLTVQQRINRRTIFSFCVFFALIAIGYWFWLRLYHERQDSGVQHMLRKGLQVNESIFGALFNDRRLAKKYSRKDAVKNVRVNGNIGIGDNFDPTLWKLKVARRPGDTLFLTLNDIKALPKTEVIFDFKCIEGWSQVTWWAGVRFSDFIQHYNLLPQAGMNYVGLMTPDSAYYVGIDMPSMLQPQTILCYEMNGAPLPMNQGYPLRLIIPVKYGIKHIKRIGTLYFSNTRPPDYWAEQGYDYYSGL
jgi:hypothetical protein